MAKASARHILVESEADCLELKKRLKAGKISPSWPRPNQNVLQGSRVAL